MANQYDTNLKLQAIADAIGDTSSSGLISALEDIADAVTGGGGGGSTIASLADVNLSNLTNGQILKWNANTNKWENTNESGGGGSVIRVVDVLFETQTVSTASITTQYSLLDYDEIVIECDENANNYINTCVLLKEEVQDAINTGRLVCPIYLNDRNAAYIAIVNSTTITYNTVTGVYIRKIYGVKYT